VDKASTKAEEHGNLDKERLAAHLKHLKKKLYKLSSLGPYLKHGKMFPRMF
jgi:hypothetical protein